MTPAPAVEGMLEVAQAILARAWDPGARLSGETEVLGVREEPTVVRAAVVGGSAESVILKNHRPWGTYDPDSGEGPSTGLFAEWAGLAYAHEVLVNEAAIPRLIGGDRRHGVIVMEDVGQGRALESVLSNGTGQEATRALGELGSALGRLAAETQWATYKRIRGRLGPFSIYSPDRVWPELVKVLGSLALKSDAIEHARDGLGRWGLCHMEPGFDNVLVVDERTYLIDFEGSTWGPVLLDAACPRMAFAHLPTAGQLTPEAVQTFEGAYHEACKFEEIDLLHASVWTAAINLAWHYPLTFDAARAPFGGEPGRRKLYTQWSSLAELDGHPAVGAFADDLVGRMVDAWGGAPAPLPIYAALVSEPRPS